MSNTGPCVGGALDGQTLESDDANIPQYAASTDLFVSLDDGGLPDWVLLGNYVFDGANWNWIPSS